MSRIGKKAVALEKGVTVELKGQTVSVKGPKGALSFTAHDLITVSQDGDGAIKLEPRDQSKLARSLWGMSRTQVSNLIKGVTSGFERKLEINGVGYKAALQGKNLQLSLGYSHDVTYPIPEGIAITTPKPTEITITGIDRQRVGQVAAEIRKFRGPEPYKGKGIKYSDEIIVRKETTKK